MKMRIVPILSLVVAILCANQPADAATISLVSGFSIGDGYQAISAVGPFRNVAVAPSGDIFVTAGHRIRKIDTSGIIQTIAGTGVAGFSGDGGLATLGQVNEAYDVAIHPSGEVYFTEFTGNRIRKIDASGYLTTIAGTGIAGYSGDGGSAIGAQVNSPAGISIDSSGNIFFADYGNYRVRKIDVAGTMTTIAGNGTNGDSGDGGLAIDATIGAVIDVAVDGSGNLLFSDVTHKRIRKIVGGNISAYAGTGVVGDTGDGGSAMAATFKAVRSIAIGAGGAVFLQDQVSGRIRKVDSGGTISAFVSSAAWNIAYDPSGYVISTANDALGAGSISRINLSGVSTQIAGNGWTIFNGEGRSAIDCGYRSIEAIAVDGSNNIFYVDRYSNVIGKIDGTSGLMSKLAGSEVGGFSGDGGPAANALLTYPQGIALDSVGRILVADTYNGRIRRIELNGDINTVVGAGAGVLVDGAAALSGRLNSPTDVDVDLAGNIYVAENGAGKVRKIDTSGTVSTLASFGVASKIQVAATGDIYCLQGNSTLSKISTGGVISTVYTLFGPEGLQDFFVSSGGRIFLTVRGRIFELDGCNSAVPIAGTGTLGYSGDGGPAESAMLRVVLSPILNSAGDLIFGDSQSIRKLSGLLARPTCAPSPPSLSEQGNAISSVVLFPNPVRHGQALCFYGVPNGANLEVRIYNIVGELVSTLSATTANSQICVSVESLASGVYVAVVTAESSEGKTKPKVSKFVVVP